MLSKRGGRTPPGAGSGPRTNTPIRDPPNSPGFVVFLTISVHEKFTENTENEFDKPELYVMIIVLKPPATGIMKEDKKNVRYQ
jgi:hypothetical protein